MKKLLMTCAVAITGALAVGSANAQYATPGGANSGAAPQTQTVPQTAPSSPAMPGQGMQGSGMQRQNAQSADLSGQTIYSAKGHKIGTVSSMTTNAEGQEAAVVDVQRFLGMGGKDVTMPVSSLHKRAKGGYTTDLTASELKALPESKGGSAQ